MLLKRQMPEFDVRAAAYHNAAVRLFLLQKALGSPDSFRLRDIPEFGRDNLRRAALPDLPHSSSRLLLHAECKLRKQPQTHLRSLATRLLSRASQPAQNGFVQLGALFR